MSAKKYNNIKLFAGIAKAVSMFILLILFVSLGYSAKLEMYIGQFSRNPYLKLILFVMIIGLVSSFLFFPLKYYIEFTLEHQYQLSNQTIGKWLWEDFKGLLVTSAIGIPVILAFYYSIRQFEFYWWLPFAVFMFLISVVLARIVPVVILPLFYKIVPFENDDLKSRIDRMTTDLKLQVENIFKFDMSKNTKKANAAFTGLGRTKRIILGDTLIEKYDNDEIETVIAHEIGHYARKHILKNIFIGTAVSFLTLLTIAELYRISIEWFNFNSIDNIAALPLLTLWGMIIGLITSPASSALSRKFEYEADEYAVKTTGKKEIFIRTLNKLTDQNLGDKEPHPLVEWFFYSHPSIKRRVENIKGIDVS